MKEITHEPHASNPAAFPTLGADISRSLGTGLFPINPDQVAPFDMNNPEDRELAERIRGIVLSNIIVNEGFRRVRAEFNAMPTWEQMTLEAKRREDPLKAFLEEQKQAQSPTSTFAPAMGQGGFRLGVPLGSAPLTTPSQPSATIRAFGTALNRTAQAALPYAQTATEFIVPGLYFSNETQNQFNAATDAYARGDGWGAFGHGALGVLNGIATGADIAVGAFAPPARIGAGALAAGAAHVIPEAARLFDNLAAHTPEFLQGASQVFERLSPFAISSTYGTPALHWAGASNRLGTPSTRLELLQYRDQVLQAHPDWTQISGPFYYNHVIDKFAHLKELFAPSSIWNWNRPDFRGSRWGDMAFMDSDNRLRLVLQTASIDQNTGKILPDEWLASYQLFQRLRNPENSSLLQVVVLPKAEQATQYQSRLSAQ